MNRSVQAVYENGVLRLLEPLPLPEREVVTVTIADEVQAKNGATVSSIPESVALSDDEFERLLDELASGPTLPHLPADFSRADVYADHD
jgi:predicted DNA-binding antitoxin AbrB/MazE fold protein